MVRGALSNLGLDSVVTAEVSVMPSCEYYFYAKIFSQDILFLSQSGCYAFIRYRFINFSALLHFVFPGKFQVVIQKL